MNEDNKSPVKSLHDHGASKVDELDSALYSRTRYHDPLGRHSSLAPATGVPTDGTPVVSEKWQSPELNELLTHEREVPEINPFMKKFFAFALFFFVATIVVAGVIFLGGSNFISSKNVDISVLGPTTVAAGEILELGVTIKNSNNTDLELANFSVQYPSGSRDPADTGRALTFSKKDLGVIGAGDEAAENVRMVLIGTTGEVKFSVEYKVRGSNATFHKDKIYEVTIGSAPVTISIEGPSSVTSGDTFTTRIKLKLSSAEILKNVMLRAEYPYGYSVDSALPAAVAENNVWALGDFSPGTEKTIEIRGRLAGENQDERTFRFYMGVSDNGEANPNFKSVLIAMQKTVTVERPSIALRTSFNGETSGTYVAPAGGAVSASIRFENNLPEKLVNPRLEAVITGAALDKASVRTQNDGFYNSGNNAIVWSLFNSTGAALLLPGEEGAVNFSFSSLPENALPSGNREISIKITLTGTPVGANAVSVTESRIVKIASQVTLSSKALHSIGSFKNTGPIPPKVESETTYSIVWNVGNTREDILDAQVTARLGQGVSWVAVESAASENIAYDLETNTVIWDLRDLSSGSGYSTSGREVAFQIALTPSLSQLGIAPTLVSNIVFSGREAESEKTVTVSSPALTTRLPYDPAFIQGDDIVQKK